MWMSSRLQSNFKRNWGQVGMNRKLNITTLRKKFEHPYENSWLLRNIRKQFIQLSRIKQKLNHHAEIAIALKKYGENPNKISNEPDLTTFFKVLSKYVLVWSASTHLNEYSLASFFILTLVLARTRVASTKRVTGGASF